MTRAHGSRGWRSRLVGGAVLGAVVLTVTQCKKDDPTAPVMVVTANTTVATTKATVPALQGLVVPFPNAGAALSPSLANSSFTLAFSNTAAATPTATFVIAGASNTTVVTNTTFGSCIFTVTSASGPGASLFPVGRVITFQPCEIRVNTAGQQVDTTLPAGVGITLGTYASGTVTVPVSIGAGGTITFGGTTIGTAPTAPATGTGG